MQKVTVMMKELMAQGMIVLTDPSYLENEHFEKGMNKPRTKFVEFHRFMAKLSNDEIKRIRKGCIQAQAKAFENFPNEMCCDLALLDHASMYHFCIRDNERGCIFSAEDSARDFQIFANMAENFEEITSDHLIGLSKTFLN